MNDDVKDQYGEFNDDGSVQYEPVVFISSGRPFHTGMGSVRERVLGTRFYYRLEAGAEVSDAQREAWQAGAHPKPSHERPMRPAISAEKKEEGEA